MLHQWRFLTMRADKKRKKKRGPKSDILKLDEENWEDAINKALTKRRPKDGWPNKDKKKSKQ